MGKANFNQGLRWFSVPSLPEPQHQSEVVSWASVSLIMGDEIFDYSTGLIAEIVSFGHPGGGLPLMSEILPISMFQSFSYKKLTTNHF